MDEQTLRAAMVERIRQTYPNAGNEPHYDYSGFLAGKKVSIDTWLGDVFPVVLREYHIFTTYEYWRSKLFID